MIYIYVYIYIYDFYIYLYIYIFIYIYVRTKTELFILVKCIYLGLKVWFFNLVNVAILLNNIYGVILGF